MTIDRRGIQGRLCPVVVAHLADLSTEALHQDAKLILISQAAEIATG